MSRHPTVKWAQRSDKVFLTVDLPDAKDVNLKLDPDGRFIFSATKDGLPYQVDFELYDQINVQESKVSVGVRSIVYVISKAENKWWKRLLKQEGKPPVFLKVDWDKWVDEEDENESGVDLDDMNFPNLNLGGDDFGMDEPNGEDDEEEEEGEIEETEEEEKTKKEREEHAAANSEQVKT